MNVANESVLGSALGRWVARAAENVALELMFDLSVGGLTQALARQLQDAAEGTARSKRCTPPDKVRPRNVQSNCNVPDCGTIKTGKPTDVTPVVAGRLSSAGSTPLGPVLGASQRGELIASDDSLNDIRPEPDNIDSISNQALPAVNWSLCCLT